MNHNKSGTIAVGAPNSAMRRITESMSAIEKRAGHMPGPWRIGYGGMDGDTTATITSAFAEYPICQLEPLGYVQANARLIAAAPELLAALRYIYNQEPAGITKSAYSKVKAAIAKAEGKV
jgi:hypothetical protein